MYALRVGGHYYCRRHCTMPSHPSGTVLRSNDHAPLGKPCAVRHGDEGEHFALPPWHIDELIPLLSDEESTYDREAVAFAIAIQLLPVSSD